MFKKDISAVEKLDAEKFETIYSSYSKKVYRLCFSYTRDSEVSKEMMQDIFLSLWERRDVVQVTDSYEKYLTKAAKFQVFQYFRKNAVQTKYLAHTHPEICNERSCTENEFYYNSLSQEVTEILDLLPCRCREVFEMSRTQGMSNSQIASALLISVKAVEKHLTKALSIFRENLKEHHS